MKSDLRRLAWYGALAAPLAVVGVAFADEPPAGAALTAEPPPLTPDTETPEEAAQRAKRPQFALPADAGVEESADAGTGDAAGKTTWGDGGLPSTRAPPSPPPPPMFAYANGYGRSAFGSQRLTRLAPREPDDDQPVRATVWARAFYDGTTSSIGDWSGVEAIGLVEVGKRVQISATALQELRESAGDLATVGVSTVITNDFVLVSNIGAGNGTDWLPVTLASVEGRARTPWTRDMWFGLGTSGSWWNDRNAQSFMGSAEWTISRTIWAEHRLSLERLAPDGSNTRVHTRNVFTVTEGREGALLFQQRFSAGVMPLDAPGVPFTLRPDRPTFDLTLGLRKWISPSYGYVVNFDIGGQRDRYVRSGLDFAVFVKL